MTIERKNATIGLDRNDTRTMWGRTLYRVVAIAAIASLEVPEGAKGGWCSDEAVVTDRVQWVSDQATFWGGTFRGGTFEGGTFEGGTFRGGTFRGGTFRGGTFRGGTFWGGTFWGGTDFATSKTPVVLLGLRWEVTITDNHMTIGCQHHTLRSWWKYRDETISKMDVGALDFWREHKATLQAICTSTGRVPKEATAAWAA